MIRIVYLVIALSLFFVQLIFSQDVRAVVGFNKVIVSPYIQVNFIEGAEESVIIESNATEDENLHIEVKGKTIHIYLEDAKLYPMEEKISKKGKIVDRLQYDLTTVKARVTYKTLNEISIRSEEDFEFLSPLKGEKFLLTVYGSSHIFLNEVELKQLRSTLYGESKLEVKKGNVQKQRYISYGTSVVDALAISSEDARIIAYGDGRFKINADQRIKITAYGNSILKYTGKAEIKKGVNIGNLIIEKL